MRRSSIPAAGALAILGVGVDLYFGRRGFLPLDQSIAFDGAWRMLSGQAPFRDFTAPNGLVPAALQVPFFRLFGVTWFALCLHAAIVNGAACAAVYALLRLCGATAIEAALFAALTAWCFYPPTGTPFTDQHAFFFTTLMFLAASIGSTAGDRRVAIAMWMAVPWLFALAFFSCQIPTAFGAIAIAAWVAAHPRHAPRWAAGMAAGTLALGIAIALAAWIWRLDARAAFAQTVLAPLGQGAGRTPGGGIVAPMRLVLGTLRRLPLWANLWSLDLAPLAIVAAIAAMVRNRSDDRAGLRLWLLASAVFITGGFVAYSKTQIEAGLGLAMLIAGLGAVAFRAALTSAADASLRRYAAAAVVVFALAGVRDTLRFVRDVDAPGLAHKKYSPAEAAAAAGRLPPALSFMSWSRGASAYEPDELTALVDHLSHAAGDFLLIGDSTILYGLTGRVSPHRELWMDPGLTMPAPGTPEFDAFERDLMARARRFGVRRVVLEGPHTWVGLSLDHFPRVKQWTMSNGCGERTFGGVRVIEVCGGS